MRFNLLVKLVLRAGAFVIGAGCATIVVGILDETFPWFWLPLLMGVAVSGVVAAQPWFRASRLAFLFCATMTVGTALTYSLSTTPVVTRVGRLFPKLALGFGAALFAVFLLSFALRGLTQRKTAAMTAFLLIPIAASCVVGYVSGGIGGSNHMVHWFMALFGMSQDQAEPIVHLIRKGIHLSAYGIVGLSLFKGALAGGAPKPRAILFALLTVFCIASFDELRQTTAPNRTGSPWDVALDMAGASTFVLIAAAFTRRSRSGSNPAHAKSKKVRQPRPIE